ncbi:MAG: methylenetetrahydrofolate reductase [NAD(P)H] [Chloroflexota bacterium]
MPANNKKDGPPAVSFEFFPPKTDDAARAQWRAFRRLERLDPPYVSVTYGAGGSTKQGTFDLVKRIHEESDVPVASHITCITHTRQEVDDYARRLWDAGITKLVVIRGDPPPDNPDARMHPDGYQFAYEMVEGLKKVHDFDISVSAYPEVHPEAPSEEVDTDNLKRKRDAGANRAITQFFFEADMWRRFVDRVQAAGIDMDKFPIIPGVMPVQDIQKISRFADACGATIPQWMWDEYEKAGDDPSDAADLAIRLTTNFTEELMGEGARQFHFYSLNRWRVCTAICENLGIYPEEPARTADRS